MMLTYFEFGSRFVFKDKAAFFLIATDKSQDF